MTEPNHDRIRDLSDNIADRTGALANEAHRPELADPAALAADADAAAGDLRTLAGWLRALQPNP
jgi:hypothetical protein